MAMNLQDLLAMTQGGGQAGPPQGQGNLLAALAPMMGGGGPAMGNGLPPANPLDAQIQQQIDALGQPEPTMDAPVGKKTPMWAKIMAGIADAGSVYASGLNSGVSPTNTLGMLLGQDQMNLDRAAGNDARRKGAEAKGKQTKAELELRRLIGEKESQSAMQAKKESDALRAKDKADDDAFRERQFAATVANQEADNARQEAMMKQQAALAQRSDQMQLKLHSLRQGESADKEQHAEYAKARQFVVAKSREYAQALKEGKVTPEQVRGEWADILDASDLVGDYREAADAFFQARTGAILAPYEYENQGPDPQSGPGVLAPMQGLSTATKRQNEANFRIGQARRPTVAGPKY